MNGKFLSKLDNVTYVDNSKAELSALPTGAIELTLGGEIGAWTLANAEGKLLGATAVKAMAWDSGTTTWTIGFSNGNALITNTTSSNGSIKYNANAPRFLNYASGQKDIQLFMYC